MRFFLSLLLLLNIINGYAQDSYVISDEKAEISIPFRLINNLIILEARVNGVPLNMIFDTGVRQTILINLHNKDSLSLKNIKHRYFSGVGKKNKKIEGIISKNNTVSLGGITNKHSNLYLINNFNFKFSETLGVRINGFVGGELVKDYIVKIDYARKKLIFYKHKPFNKRLLKRYKAFPLNIINAKPYIDLEIFWTNKKAKPVKRKFLIDTGNNDAVWFFQNNSFSKPQGLKAIKDYFGFGFSGEISGLRTKVRRISLGNFNFNKVYVALPDSTQYKHITAFNPFDGLLGNEVLKRFYVFLDYKHKTIYLRKYWKNYRENFLFNNSGAFFAYDGKLPIKVKTVSTHIETAGDNYTQSPRIVREFSYAFQFVDRIVVYHIRKGSPAERSGLSVGDVLLKVNGHNVYHYNLYDLDKIFFYKENGRMNLWIKRNGVVMKLVMNNVKQL